MLGQPHVRPIVQPRPLYRVVGDLELHRMDQVEVRVHPHRRPRDVPRVLRDRRVIERHVQHVPRIPPPPRGIAGPFCGIDFMPRS